MDYTSYWDFNNSRYTETLVYLNELISRILNNKYNTVKNEKENYQEEQI